MIYVLRAETKGVHLVLAKTALMHAGEELFKRLGGIPAGFSEAAAKAINGGDMTDLADHFLHHLGDFVWLEQTGDPPKRRMYTMESPSFHVQQEKDRH